MVDCIVARSAQIPYTIWITGLPGSGKTTLAYRLKAMLASSSVVVVIDGDEVRASLSRDLGFSPEHRLENIRRAASLCKLLNDQGVIAIAAFIAPLAAHRACAKEIVGQDAFLQIYLSTPLAVCEARDPKGFYKMARRGTISDFTAIGSAYEPPTDPWMSIDTSNPPVEECATAIVAALKAAGLLAPPRTER